VHKVELEHKEPKVLLDLRARKVYLVKKDKQVHKVAVELLDLKVK
jgi:hypothetical protein